MNFVLTFIVLGIIWFIEHGVKSEVKYNKEYIKLDKVSFAFHIFKLVFVIILLDLIFIQLKLFTSNLIDLSVISLLFLLVLGPILALLLSFIKSFPTNTICETAYSFGYIFCPQLKYPNLIYKDITLVCCTECYGAVIGVVIANILNTSSEWAAIPLIFGLILWAFFERFFNLKNTHITHFFLFAIGLIVGFSLRSFFLF